MRKIWNSLSWQQRIIETVCFVIAALGVITAIRMNFVGRSLWYDEAALAWSLSQRSLTNLTATGLDLVQAAPVGWLYFLKGLTIIFGNTDFVLRVPSILFYIGMLILLWYLSARVLHLYYPMIGVAFAASLPLLLQYANVFKPYMADCFFALLAVILYQRYLDGKLKPLPLGIYFAVLVWFSNPVCFVEGGLIGVGGLLSLLQKDFAKFKKQILICIPLAVSFLVYYVYWLRKIDDGMNGFWQDYRFPLVPTSLAAVRKMLNMLDILFWQFYRLEWLVLIIVAVGLILYVCRAVAALQNKANDNPKEATTAANEQADAPATQITELHLGIYATFFLAAFASWIGMFPVNKRMWLFIYPLLILLVFSILDELLSHDKTQESENLSDHITPKHAQSPTLKNTLIGIALVGVVLVNGGIRYYQNPANVYWNGYEVKAELNYLKSVVRNTDKVYVCSQQAPIFAYYNHYNMKELEDTGNTVFVGEHPLAKDADCEAELNYIKNSKTCYIVSGDTWDEEGSNGLLFSELEKYGTLTKVYDDYDTPLFYFESGDNK